MDALTNRRFVSMHVLVLDAPKVQRSDTNLLRFVMHLQVQILNKALLCKICFAKAKSLTNRRFVQKRGKKICSYALTNRRFVSMHLQIEDLYRCTYLLALFQSANKCKCNCFEHSDTNLLRFVMHMMHVRASARAK